MPHDPNYIPETDEELLTRIRVAAYEEEALEYAKQIVSRHYVLMLRSPEQQVARLQLGIAKTIYEVIARASSMDRTR